MFKNSLKINIFASKLSANKMYKCLSEIFLVPFLFKGKKKKMYHKLKI